jgi:hypothetical protein
MLSEGDVGEYLAAQSPRMAVDATAAECSVLDR